MQEQINSIKINMAELNKDVKYIREEISELRQDFKDFCDKKADKWVEKIAVGTVLIFAVSALYYIFSHVGLPTP
jgi:cell division protein FtsB